MYQQDNNGKQVNQYDKIIKENLEITLPVIIKEILGLDILVSEELPDDVQHTKERKPDALKKVTDASGNTYVLQVEFQLEDEKDMVYRMADYSIMLMRKYRLPIKQYVIFLKDTHPLMPTFLDTSHHKFHFTLIKIAEVNYKLFLKSNNPEVKMLGILANFTTQETYEVAKSIIEGIQTFASGEFAESRYFKQLRIFVQLRSSVEQKFERAMQSVSTFFKEENDFLYRRGEAKGLEKGLAKGLEKGLAKGKAAQARREEKKCRTIVENLILELGSSDEQAARIAEVSVEYVKNVRAKLRKK